MPVKSKVSLTDAEPELASVAKEVGIEVENSVKTDAGADVTTAVKAAEGVALGVETSTQATTSVATAVEKTVTDAEAPVKAAVADVTTTAATTEAEKVVDTAEHDALKVGEAVLDAHVPVAAPIIDALEPEVETTLFHVTNVVTSDFIHKVEAYVVELADHEIANLHVTDIRQKIASKIEAYLATGERIVASALHVTKLDPLAKFLPHA